METIEALRRRIKSAQDLYSVVRTMKALAAVTIRQYEKAVESLSEYSRTVELGFQVVMKQKPPGAALVQPALNDRLGAVVFGSDQGMVGQFNEVIVRHALGELRKRQVGAENISLLAVGGRVLSHFEETGQRLEELITLPGSVAAVTPVVRRVVLKIESWRLQRGIDNILLFFNSPASAASYRPRTLQLLPVDMAWFKDLAGKPWPCRTLPFFTMEWDRLFSLLVREYLFVWLYRAFAESLASENASRLASMQVAERNIENRLNELHGQYHQQRQNSIDAELFDLVSGFEALSAEAV